jgi:WD40 repeat protein
MFALSYYEQSSGVRETEIYLQTGHPASVNSVSFNPDGKALASESADNTVTLGGVATGKEIRTLVGHSSTVFLICMYVSLRNQNIWIFMLNSIMRRNNCMNITLANVITPGQHDKRYPNPDDVLLVTYDETP